MKIYLRFKGLAEPCTGDVVQQNTVVREITKPIEKDVYRMSFIDGTSVTASSEQVWTYYDLKHGKVHTADFETLYNRASKKDLLTTYYDFKAMSEPFFFDVVKIPKIPPVIAGAFCSLKVKPQNRLPEEFLCLQESLGVAKARLNKRNLIKYLQESWWNNDKFIPSEAYIPDEIKYTTVARRCEFLTAFFLNSGVPNAHKNRIYVKVPSKRLLNDLMWLIRSLGGQAILNMDSKLTIIPNECVYSCLTGKLRWGLVNYDETLVPYKRLQKIEYLGKMSWSEIYTNNGEYMNEDFILIRGDYIGESEKG